MPYVHTHVYVCTICTYTYVCMYTKITVHSHTHTNIYIMYTTYVYICMYMYTVYIHTYIHIYIDVCMYVSIYFMYVHTYTHMHNIHIQTLHLCIHTYIQTDRHYTSVPIRVRCINRKLWGSHHEVVKDGVSTFQSMSCQYMQAILTPEMSQHNQVSKSIKFCLPQLIVNNETLWILPTYCLV